MARGHRCHEPGIRPGVRLGQGRLFPAIYRRSPVRELALFAGAGGGILGGKLLGWRTVCAVELNANCRRTLLDRQRDGYLPRFPIWDDVRTFDGRSWARGVDIVTGGFPCQDISPAGYGAGIEGERSGLWVEMARILGEVRPRYALVENSAALTSRGLDRVLGDLAALGFDARWGVLGACHAGLDHRESASGSLPTPSGVNGGNNHTMGRVDEWGGSSNPLRGTVIGYLCLPEFEELVMGWPVTWTAPTPLEMDRFQRWLQWHSRSWPRDP
jgi:hypothetical protein